MTSGAADQRGQGKYDNGQQYGAHAVMFNNKISAGNEGAKESNHQHGSEHAEWPPN